MSRKISVVCFFYLIAHLLLQYHIDILISFINHIDNDELRTTYFQQDSVIAHVTRGTFEIFDVRIIRTHRNIGILYSSKPCELNG